MPAEQGDLLRVDGIKWPVIVVSNNFFNTSGKVVACPILKTPSKARFTYR